MTLLSACRSEASRDPPPNFAVVDDLDRVYSTIGELRICRRLNRQLFGKLPFQGSQSLVSDLSHGRLDDVGPWRRKRGREFGRHSWRTVGTQDHLHRSVEITKRVLL